MSELEYAVERVTAWSSDALLFVQEALGACPSRQQAAVLRAFSLPGAHVAIRSGHGVGKSTMMAWAVLWALSVFGDEVKIPVTAPTAHQIGDIIWPEVMSWRRRLPEPWQSELEVHDDKIYFRSSSGFAAARTARKDRPEALQGFHAKHLVFIADEASGIDDIIFDTARGALSTKGARILMAANPTRTSGYFYNAFHKNRGLWRRFRFSCLDSPFVTKAYVREIAEEYGENSDMYRVRVLGDFPHTSDMQFMPADIVEAAWGRHVGENLYKAAPRILGVDVARFGQDRSVVFMRQGLASWILWERQGADTVEVAEAVANIEDAHSTFLTAVDGVGVGAGVVDTLRRMGRHPFEIQFGGVSTDPKCRNKRAEMWWKMREWLKSGGCIPNKQALKDDLLGPFMSYTDKGLAQLERKEDMKKRGLASPDYGDALALTFAVNAVESGGDEKAYSTADDDYDIYG